MKELGNNDNAFVVAQLLYHNGQALLKGPSETGPPLPPPLSSTNLFHSPLSSISEKEDILYFVHVPAL